MLWMWWFAFQRRMNYAMYWVANWFYSVCIYEGSKTIDTFVGFNVDWSSILRLKCIWKIFIQEDFLFCFLFHFWLYQYWKNEALIARIKDFIDWKSIGKSCSLKESPKESSGTPWKFIQSCQKKNEENHWTFERRIIRSSTVVFMLFGFIFICREWVYADAMNKCINAKKIFFNYNLFGNCTHLNSK